MKHEHFVVQSPASPAAQLILLFHGVGDNPVAMGEIGRYFAKDFPQALVVSVGGPSAFGTGNGRQWFSVQGVTEENRAERIAEVMPTFIEIVRYWQRQSGVGYAGTALVGFSQGSIMALEALKAQPELAGRVVAFSGRFANLPEQALGETVVHLIHGEQDATIAVQHAQAAAERLRANGVDVTLDVEQEVGHAINQGMMNNALERLHYYVPQRYWDEAMFGKRGDLIAFK
ncbi:esterase [Serratia entomophila]|uniref:esterase n=1 Tax=Serratia entomophila TaxID=42906 RepID=UPI00217B8E89|nr:esterase [Serratia entomophila]CAI1066530.1 putative hydrolase [Serratia entomophila]CAI1074859.1 putative hydrolase [Serratia entomophila]CAI1078452.1 putative hydrolase [Serratia entomophila]CAI1097758.1 putative hydrolase [Serratia entomophila]CAI1878556.1 putative hydrolase [Serratia entomophila]